MSQLRRKAFIGVAWNGIETASQVIVSWTSTIILARLLSPKDFGTFGLVIIFNGFIQILIDFGFGNALIQDEKPSEEDINSVFWLNVAIGVLFTVTFIALAHPIARYFDIPELGKYILATSFCFIINSLKIVQYSLTRKNLDFRKIFKISISAQLISLLITIYLAWIGMGIWSLVIQYLLTAALSAIFYNIFSDWHAKLKFNLMALKKYSNFSLNLVGNNILNYWARNLDNLLIGKFIGVESLGYYTKAYSLLMFPIRSISGTIVGVMFPALSKIKSSIESVQRNYLNLINVISFITFPGMTFLFFEAEGITLIIFGEKWLQIVPLLKVFSFLGAIQSILTTTGVVFMSQNRMDIVFKFGLVTKILLIIFMIVGLQYGLIGMAYSILTFSVITGIPQLYLSSRLIKLTLINVLKSFLPILFTILMSALVYALVRHVLNFDNLIFNILIHFLIFGLIYLLFAVLFRLSSITIVIEGCRYLMSK